MVDWIDLVEYFVKSHFIMRAVWGLHYLVMGHRKSKQMNWLQAAAFCVECLFKSTM